MVSQVLWYAAVSFFVLVGLVCALRRPPGGSRWRFDLFRLPGLRRVVKSTYFPFLVRLVPAALFVFVVATGLLGRKYGSLAAPFTWLFWWTLLIFFVAFGGKIFCAACPWDFFANLFQFGRPHGSKRCAGGLNRKWPRALANTYVAVGFFIVFTWLELGVDIARNSYLTALLGLAVVILVVLFALVYERRAFCRYACPVGRISGIYAQFSPLELRRRDEEVCRRCRTKDCIRGTERSTPCPTWEVPFRLEQNTYCILCTECIRSCPNDNLTLRVRPPALDLHNLATYRFDEALLIWVILVLTFFHGLTMTNLWSEWTSRLGSWLGTSHVGSFTVLMSALLAAAAALFWSVDAALRKVYNRSGLSHRLVYGFVPIALGYHIGHNTMHVMREIAYLVPVLNDPFGFGWNLFGWRDYVAGPLADHGTMVLVEVAAICVGFYFSASVVRSRAAKLAAEEPTLGPRGGRVLYAVHFALLFLFGVLALWLVAQPMVMRGGM